MRYLIKLNATQLPLLVTVKAEFKLALKLQNTMQILFIVTLDVNKKRPTFNNFEVEMKQQKWIQMRRKWNIKQ